MGKVFVNVGLLSRITPNCLIFPMFQSGAHCQHEVYAHGALGEFVRVSSGRLCSVHAGAQTAVISDQGRLAGAQRCGGMSFNCGWRECRWATESFGRKSAPGDGPGFRRIQDAGAMLKMGFVLRREA